MITALRGRRLSRPELPGEPWLISFIFIYVRAMCIAPMAVPLPPWKRFPAAIVVNFASPAS